MLRHIENSDLEVIYLSSKERLNCSGTFKGNQLKWYSNGKFVKLNTWKWYEDISEVLVSYFLKFTNIDYFVKYYPCKIYEDNSFLGLGCYSYNFLNEDEQDITFYRLAKSAGYDISTWSFDDTRDIISDIIGFDIKGYLSKCLCLDAITYNEDRHFNNLSVIRTKNGYRESPIYDNGLSCLSDIFSYPLDEDINSLVKKVYAKPFNTSFKSQITSNMLTPICLDVDSFLDSVEPVTFEEIRALEVIKLGIKNMEGLAWEGY